MASLIEKVRRFCKRDGLNKMKLATALHYKSDSTISAWIKKNRIPEFRRENVEKILSEMKG